ncbi:hypothetical protein [Streptomyces sp. WG7]|uniref:hypothetical protein n=1 Tax=Streptomyces sp. WG7 TaxID=3417650 RepID=UPI003CFB0464
MFWSAALPGAALRLMRTAAGRRALRVALLVGGLFVLGVFCGERAQAAEGTPSVRGVAGQVVDVSAERPREARGSATPQRPGTVRSAGTAQDSDTAQDSGTGQDFGTGQGSRRGQSSWGIPGSDVVVPDTRPVVENVVRSVEGRLVRPVGDAVEAVTEGLGAVAQAQAPPLEALPALPSAPSLPSSPPLSVQPDLSGTTGLPSRLTPVDPDSHPEPSKTVPAASDAADTPDISDTSDTSDVRVPDGAGGVGQVAYGPEQVADGAPAAARVDIHHAVPAPTEHAPVHQAPTGDPDGTLGGASGADQGTPRQGDAHAVTPHHRIPFRLVPGALVGADAAETQDRHRDIPVSPA